MLKHGKPRPIQSLTDYYQSLMSVGAWEALKNTARANVKGLNSLITPKTLVPNPLDFQYPPGTYGTMIPQIFGKGLAQCALIWEGGINAHFLGSGLNVTSTETQICSFAYGVCRGPIQSYRRIWLGDKLVYDSLATPNYATPLDVNSTTFYLGTEVQTADADIEDDKGVGSVPGFRGLAYIVFKNIDLGDWSNQIPSCTVEVIQDTGVILQDVLDSWAGQVGLDESEYDFSCAQDAIDGLIATNQSPARDNMAPILNVFGQDLVEIDGKLKVTKRGGDVLATVSTDEIGARLFAIGQETVEAPLGTIRTNEDDLPSRVDFTYISAAMGYDTSIQSAVRYAKANVDQKIQYQSALVLTEDSARQKAEYLLYTAWLERNGYSFRLPPKYLIYAPNSVVEIPVNGINVRVRIIQMDVPLLGPIGCMAVPDAVEVLTQTVTGAVVQTTAQAIAGVVDTTIVAWSGVELTEADRQTVGFYVAATGGDGWQGAKIYYSPNGGTDYILAGSVAARSVIGESTSALGTATDPTVWDETNTVDVTLFVTGTLDDATQDQVLGGQNRAVLGDELIGFTTATPGSPLDYTLSELRRGLFNTIMSGHTSSDRFVLISPAILRVTVPETLIGETIKVKAVSPGQTLADVSPVDVLIAGNTSPYSSSGPGSRGQIMYTRDGSRFTAETPLVSDDGIILTEDDTRYIIVVG